ncbi:hypothetical protein HMPREF0602_0330 [Neisseria meningitidis ATCC 13091]|uniref:Uncharacterized protein n=4 Tax=Neisseria meningitidis TaxID=487 RepID=A0A0H5QBQ5_NEIMI|nr:hypothetical protein HMPREF0602_0330 [Neisseria meningitidis ATCC 13091]CBA05305.1 hypothetical protein predicted by Glimmer/Critica [Neisseria meningitidis alpha275]CCA44129.1 hypothetical protein NMALPHA522_0588 [Neisseria meningitidis alpha522]CRY98866.1 FIG00847534: hypothetical protein [Neisseria meningitidis serogroup B]
MSEIKSQNKPKHFLRETAFYQRLCRLKAARGRFAPSAGRSDGI